MGELVAVEPVRQTERQKVQNVRVRVSEVLYWPRRQPVSDLVTLLAFVSECAPAPVQFRGGPYFFAAHRRPTGDLILDSLQPAADAARDLRYIRDSVRFGRNASIQTRAYATTWGKEQIRVRVARGRKVMDWIGPSGTEHVFSNLAPGTYRVSGELANYIHDTGDPSLDLPPGACLRLDVRMVPDAVISGVVLTPDGQPVAGIAVATEGMPAATTDEQGRFRLRFLAPGVFRITANAGSFSDFGPWAPAAARESPFEIGLTTQIRDVRIVLGPRLTKRLLTVQFGEKGGFGALKGWMPSSPDLAQSIVLMGNSPLLLPIWQEMQYEIKAAGKTTSIPPGNQDVTVVAH